MSATIARLVEHAIMVLQWMVVDRIPPHEESNL